jgi:glycosyltransferase involved in cell wall biosynthesis
MSYEVESSDLLVFSHLRWGFVFQRPQHLMSRFAQHRRVFFFEPPVIGKTEISQLHVEMSKEGVQVIVPYLPKGLTKEETDLKMLEMLDEHASENRIENYSAWYYNPMYQPWTKNYHPSTVIYDCMDELSGFKDCPPEMKMWEKHLLEKAHVVFTGGHSIYEAKKNSHHNIHPFPSSIDHKHFREARRSLPDPQDQEHIPHPRIGFYGVIEERIDLDLLESIAKLRPDYHFIMLGPVIRIDEDSLPKLPNIHYLGQKDYQELPVYLSGWDCAMMPFALNDATRFISPTKTPEFLAAGKPVVSTPINDVINPYATKANLIYIARSPEKFVECIERAMREAQKDKNWLKRVDKFIDGNSWDKTFSNMARHEVKLSPLSKISLLGSYADQSIRSES